MKFSLLYGIIIILSIKGNISSNNNEKVEEQLLFVYEHSRHGSRAPNNKKNGLYNNITQTDSYNIFWEKPGILTEYGKLQHFFLGLRNKYKYENFINFSQYNKNELILRTTGVNRCTESLYYQLLGMYYKDNNTNNSIEFNEEKYKYSMPPNIKNWKNDEKFFKINKKIKAFLKNKKVEGLNLTSYKSEIKNNFHIKSIKRDFIFVSQKCKNHEKYVKQQRKKYKQTIKLNFIDNNYTDKLKKSISFLNESYLYKRGISKSLADHFISDYLNGRRELHEFSEKTGIDLHDFYKKCENVYFFYIYNIYCFSKSCILNGSKLIKEIINYFDNAIEYSKNKKKNENLKMIIDMGHDVTVNNIQIIMNKAFNIDYTYCNFACNVFFELYKVGKDNNYIIKYFENDLQLLNIDFYRFRNKIIKLLWSDSEIDKFCNGDKSKIFKIREEQDKIDINKINHSINIIPDL